MNWSRFIHICFILILVTSCTTNNNVRGALPSKTPNFVAGAGAGGVAGAATRGLVSKTKSVFPGFLAGAMLGAAIGSYDDSEGLVQSLKDRGVNIIRIGDSTDIIIPMDIIFDGGDTEVKISAHDLLEDVVKYVKQYGTAPISVFAYSDNVDGMLQRLDKTEKQAQSVTTFLWSRGINLQRIKFSGLASLHSVADFKSATGAGYNRRIQISIWREDFRAPSPFYIYTANQNEECWKTDNPDVC